MIGSAVTSSSAHVNQVLVGHTGTIINAFSVSFSIFLIVGHIILKDGKT